MNRKPTGITTREQGPLRAILRAIAINTRLFAWSIFTVGFALYFVLNIGLVFLRIQARSTPIKVDDAYVYIIKAVQMVTCFRQSCPALEDLRSQLNIPSTDREMAWVLSNEYGRAFVVYHPLHSALVVLLRAIGLSWEGAYEGIRLAGSIFICTVMPYWLITLWGPGPAGIALVLLSFMFFPDQGLHYVVPSNLALGIAMLVWARISARDGAAEWSLALGTLAMVAMHPIGQLCAIASVCLFLLFTTGRPWTKGKLTGVLFSSSIIALSFLLPVVVSRPALNALGAYPPVASWPRSWYGILGYGLLNNFSTIDGIIRNWIALYGCLASAAIITSLGLLSLTRVERSVVVKHSLVLLGLLIVSTIHVLPRYPAIVFQRVWVPMAILLTGATGQVAWILLVGSLSYFVTSQRNMSSPITRLSTGFSSLSATPNWILALIIAVGVFIAVRIETGIGQGLRDIRVQAQAMREDLWALDPVQPKLMLTQARQSDIVLYLDEVPMHFYFTHGALETRAIYYPALVNPSKVSFLDPRRYDSPRIYQPVAVDALAETAWLHLENLRYLVTWSPILQLRKDREAMIPMSAFSSIEYSSPMPVALNNARVYLINSGKEATLQVMYTSENITKTILTPVPGAWSGWLALPEELSSSALHTFRLKIDRAAVEVYMKGMRLDNTNLNWPWGQRATLVFHSEDKAGQSEDKAGQQAIRFDPDELLPIQGLHLSVKILNDSGSTVLGELERTSSKK